MAAMGKRVKDASRECQGNVEEVFNKQRKSMDEDVEAEKIRQLEGD
jgi:hypothetical protein